MTVLQELGQKFFGSNADELTYRSAERLVGKRFAGNLLRDSIGSHTDSADGCLPDAFIHDAFEHASSHKRKVSQAIHVAEQPFQHIHALRSRLLDLPSQVLPVRS